MLGMNFADYIDKGLGTVSFLVLVALIIYYATNIAPELKNQSAVVQNNTEAIKEVSRSNDNVATALTLLQSSIEANTRFLSAHDDRACEIQTEVVKLSERTKACLTKAQGV
jgi:hypothetical protein